MTLNGIMTVILRFSPNSVALRADYVKVCESKKVAPLKLFATFSLRLSIFLTHTVYSLRRKCSPNNLVFSDISFMAIFAEVTEDERIIYRHLRGMLPRLDYDASESQSMISI